MTIDFKEALFVFEEEEHKKTKFMCAESTGAFQRIPSFTFESLNSTPPKKRSNFFQTKSQKDIRIVERRRKT